MNFKTLDRSIIFILEGRKIEPVALKGLGTCTGVQ